MLRLLRPLPRSVEFITEGDEADRRAGRPNLVAAVKVIFSNAGFTPGAGLGVLFRVLPDFAEPFLFWLAFTAMVSGACQPA